MVEGEREFEERFLIDAGATLAADTVAGSLFSGKAAVGSPGGRERSLGGLQRRATSTTRSSRKLSPSLPAAKSSAFFTCHNGAQPPDGPPAGRRDILHEQRLSAEHNLSRSPSRHDECGVESRTLPPA